MNIVDFPIPEPNEFVVGLHFKECQIKPSTCSIFFV